MGAPKGRTLALNDETQRRARVSGPGAGKWAAIMASVMKPAEYFHLGGRWAGCGRAV